MKKLKRMIIFSVGWIFACVVACSPAPAPPPATATLAPSPLPAATQSPAATQPPAATQAPIATVPPAVASPTATRVVPTAIPTSAAAPKRGGRLTMVMSQSPVTLNFMLGTQVVMDEVLIYVVEGMTRLQPDGSRLPILAKELPTLQNGGVSADGKTITYKLRDGLVFSDGNPMTCEDVKFTWTAWTTPGVGVSTTSGYSQIENVECPDPQTVVVKYKNFFAPYITLFGSILPKNVGDPKNMKNWAYNRKPIGTGPFKVDEWVADDHITLSRNEKYRGAADGKPYLDQVIIRIVPSIDVAMQLLASGEADVMWNPGIDRIPQLQELKGVKFTAPPSIGGERLFINMAENKDPSDPTKPHPILGDVRVRQALGLAINKQKIVDKLLFGKSLVGTSDLNIGPYQCAEVKPIPYDPAQAKQLLDQAGWVTGADGVRVAKGAKYAPDGTRLRLKYATTSGNKLREDTQVLVMEDAKAVGIELYVENAPSSVVIGTWDAGSPRRHGNFDLNQYTTNAAIDPASEMENLYASWQIPSPNNKGGMNTTRFSDPKVDQLLKQAQQEPDMSKRQTMYCQIIQIGSETVNFIHLYQSTRIHAYRERLQGWVGTAFNNSGWNAENWWLAN